MLQRTGERHESFDPSFDHASTVRELTPADVQLAADIIVLAFAADPVTRWTWPDPRTYLAAMPRLVRAFGGKAFACGGAYCVGDLPAPRSGCRRASSPTGRRSAN